MKMNANLRENHHKGLDYLIYFFNFASNQSHIFDKLLVNLDFILIELLMLQSIVNIVQYYYYKLLS